VAEGGGLLTQLAAITEFQNEQARQNRIVVKRRNERT
jgi:hypothetical protein